MISPKDPKSIELSVECATRCARLGGLRGEFAHPATQAVLDVASRLGLQALRDDVRAREVRYLLRGDETVRPALREAISASLETLAQDVAGLVEVVTRHKADLEHAPGFAAEPLRAEQHRERAIAGLVARETLARLSAAASWFGLGDVARRAAECTATLDATLRDALTDLHALRPVASRLAEELGDEAVISHWWLMVEAGRELADIGDAASDEPLDPAISAWIRDRAVGGPGRARLRLSGEEMRTLSGSPGGRALAQWMGDGLEVMQVSHASTATEREELAGPPGHVERVAEQLADGVRRLRRQLALDAAWRLPIPAIHAAWTAVFQPAPLADLAALAADDSCPGDAVVGMLAPVGFRVGRVWVEHGFGVVVWGSRLAEVVETGDGPPGETMLAGWLLFPRRDVLALNINEQMFSIDEWEAGGIFVEHRGEDGDLVCIDVTRRESTSFATAGVPPEVVYLDRVDAVVKPGGLELVVDLLGRAEANAALDLLSALRDGVPRLDWGDVSGLEWSASLRARDHDDGGWT